MRPSSNIQFRTKDAVMEAFELARVCNWSLWSRDQLHYSYMGDSIEDAAQMLEQWLTWMEDSPAMYMLKLHSSVSGDVINNKTPYNASFNFKLMEKDSDIGAIGEVRRMQRQIAEMAEREPEDPEPPQSVTDQLISGVLKSVAERPEYYINLISGWFSGKPMQATALAGPPPSSGSELYMAVEAIVNVEPSAGQFLMKLGAIANEDPNRLRKLIKTASAFI